MELSLSFNRQRKLPKFQKMDLRMQKASIFSHQKILKMFKLLSTRKATDYRNWNHFQDGMEKISWRFLYYSRPRVNAQQIIFPPQVLGCSTVVTLIRLVITYFLAQLMPITTKQARVKPCLV